VERPAEFGNWDDQTDLDADDDAAHPELVLITLGADDLQFSAIVEDCIKNGDWYAADVERAALHLVEPKRHDPAGLRLPTLKETDATIAKWSKARAVAKGVAVPKVIFTNYTSPLPPDGAIGNDTNWLHKEQLRYLSSLVDRINGTIEDTITGLGDPDVALADISRAYQSAGAAHIWCSSAPWASSLSIYSVTSPSSFESRAPFHPTPDGARRASASRSPRSATAGSRLPRADLP